MKDANVLTHVPGRKTPAATSPTTERGAAIGDVLGKCLLIDLIGRGATCTVYRALHQSLNLPVAVKVLPLDAGEAHRRAYEELKFEARLLAQLPHPHIVRVLDFEDDPALPFLVLECVEGPSLEDLIPQSGRLAVDRACAIIGQVAEALGALWKLGAVHRDVKPGNVLLARDGLAKLADFGQAILVEEQEIAGFEANGQTYDNVSGTPAYLSPEQFLEPASVDHRSDIYALGATFYQAVTGELPYGGKSRMEVLLKRVREKPTPPHEVVPGLSPAVSEVILTMMAREPDDRYQTLEELREALAGLTEEADERPLARGTGFQPVQADRVETCPTMDQTERVPTIAEIDLLPEGDAPEEAAEHQQTVVMDIRPTRRSFWQSLVPGSEPAAPADTEPKDQWLRFVKRTLAASATRKAEE